MRSFLTELTARGEELPITVAGVVALMTRVMGDATEAGELLSLVADMPRHWVRLAAEEPLADVEVRVALEAAQRRARGMPMQYAARRAAFRQLTLEVDERVLIPRPETEMLVEIVLEARRNTDGDVAVDVGTGSGAIALALVTEGKFERVIATDISMDALEVAALNAERYLEVAAGRLELRHGSLLSPIEEMVSVIVSNPPYIAFAEATELPALVRDWEPAVALFAGDNGNGVANALISAATSRLLPGGLLALEVDTRRVFDVAAVARDTGVYDEVRVINDLTGRERFVVAKRREEG